MKLLKVKTLLGLGFRNLARVAYYQVGVRTGLNPVKKLDFLVPKGVFFKQPVGGRKTVEPSYAWDKNYCFFGKKVLSTGIPNWHVSCFTGRESPSNVPWYKIADFNSEVGDIKGIWEVSRFDWVIAFAQRAANGDNSYMVKLNNWLNDWCENNQPYNGVNWKCGQEASIRVMHLACAALILEQVNKTSQPLLELVEAHLQRISPTILYAIAQDNNHGTSEASALFIGGDWLYQNGNMRGFKWREQGRKWLENRASRLIMSDGTFSQYSTNYHRVMLDAYSIAEVWRAKSSLPVFSKKLTERLCAAVSWIYELTDDETGDVPNLGANDGARLLPLTDTDYRDFRPSIQLAAVLFHSKAAWISNGIYDQVLYWLGIAKPSASMAKQDAVHYSDGGFFTLRSKESNSFALFTYPKFKFRPSQNDALHLDFWVDGENVLRDGGTYSYNAGQHYIDYYGGVQSHNTVEIDGHDPMPRLSRFLLGAWLQPRDIIDQTHQRNVAAGYKDYLGRIHHRSVSLKGALLVVNDKITGVNQKAILRWRLKPSNWVIDGTNVTDGKHSIKIISDVNITNLKLIEGRESRYYYEETTIPVLEIEIDNDCTLTTEYKY